MPSPWRERWKAWAGPRWGAVRLGRVLLASAAGFVPPEELNVDDPRYQVLTTIFCRKRSV